VVARLPLPIGGGGALCALNRCRAERGNEDEEPSLARAQATPATKDAWRGVAVPRGAQAPPNDATPQHRPHDVAITNLELERTASSSCREADERPPGATMTSNSSPSSTACEEP